MKQRGITEEFLKPRYEDLASPWALLGMEEAVERILQAVERQEKIMVWGDYDVDGVTASTVMANTLELAGVKPENLTIMLPNRFTDGYGMSPRLVAEAVKRGVSLVITVDCGSSGEAVTRELTEAGIDTVVTDHHECPEQLPRAVAIVNPKRHDVTLEGKLASLRELAGVGVAFKVAQALVEKGAIPRGQEKWLLDLVVIGTICDSMKLVGENRILGYYGMKVLAQTRRKGVQELMRSSGVRTLNSEAIGFQLGPRLNAAGRLLTADLALKLLRTQSATEAAALATELEDLNKRRKQQQQLAVKEIEAGPLNSDPVIVVEGAWHEGILGIVAGRVMEKYRRPTFVLTEVEDGILKGSGRSFGDFSLADALSFAKDEIVGGGGHAAAAGVQVRRAQIDDFREKINEFYRSLRLREQEKYLREQADLTVSELVDFSPELFDELTLLEPFGNGNEAPLFKLKGLQIREVARMGQDKNHLRLEVIDKANRRLKLVAFFASEDWLRLTPEDKAEFVIRVEQNEYRGCRSIEGMVEEIVRQDSEF